MLWHWQCQSAHPSKKGEQNNMDKGTLSKQKVNFLLDADTVAFLAEMRSKTGLTQSKVVAMLVHRYGDDMSQDLQKYSRKEQVEVVSLA